MAFLNGADAPADRRMADDGESGSSNLQSGVQTGFQSGFQAGPKPAGQSGPEDVTITIRGSMAARMLGRGDAEERILDELNGMKQRLVDMEAAAARRAADHEDLQQTVRGLQETVARLGGHMADQMTELRTELSRIRSAFDNHALGVVHLPGQLERVQGQVGLLQSQLTHLQLQVDNLERSATPAPPIGGGAAPTDGTSGPKQPGWLWDKLDKWRQPEKPAANGEAAANGSWLKQRLNGLWLW
jgi:hypothetical protein